MHHVSYTEYAQLVTTSTIVSTDVYVIDDDYVEMYGQQIRNLADATHLSDAVNYF